MPNPKPRQYADGTFAWIVQYRVRGKVVKDTFLSFDAADEFCALIATVGGESARKVLESRRTGRDVPTLREWVATYLDAESGMLTGIEEGTRDGYRGEAERTFLKFLGHYPLDAITPDVVGQWVSWQEQQPVHRDRDKEEPAKVSAKTVKNAHSLLSSILAAAVKRKKIDDNPARGVRISKGVKREPVFLSPAEFATILHFMPPRYQRLVMFLAGTGCRWGEATAMTWGDVTLHGTPPTVRVTKAWKRGPKSSSVLKHPKSSKARRTISLFPELVAAMGDAGGSDTYLFTGMTGNRVQHSHFRARGWVKAVAAAMDKEKCAESGMTLLTRAPTIHDLRHSHASWLIARGVPLPYIQARLGHEKITTTVDVYGHLVPDAHEQMASVVASTLKGVSASMVRELPAPLDDEPELEFADVVED